MELTLLFYHVTLQGDDGYETATVRVGAGQVVEEVVEEVIRECRPNHTVVSIELARGECDACGKKVPMRKLTRDYAAGGVEGSFCPDCMYSGSIDDDDEAEAED